MNGSPCHGLGSNPSCRRLTEGDLLMTTTSSMRGPTVMEWEVELRNDKILQALRLTR